MNEIINSTDRFRLIKTSPGSSARTGELITPHGVVPTPVFAPVGSQATVKTIAPEELKELGVNMLLANTYHLYLRPGIDVIENMGGLHRFMSWNRAILTDSGGYQIFSLSRLRNVSDKGALFRSHIDGSQHLITPQSAIQFQESLGADIIMVLDECPSPTDTFEAVEQATERTHRWAEICQRSQTRKDQTLFAIVQGGLYPELRRRSVNRLTALGFTGYAIGGLSLGEPKEVMLAMVGETAARLPSDKPRYLMGIGSPEDIIEAVARGIDIFDSALPTQVARKGALFTRQGRYNIRSAAYRQVETPLEPDCDCYACRNFSAGYLHHLFKCREMLAYRLATIHNLSFMSRLMQEIRNAIASDNFESFRDTFIAGYEPTDEKTRLAQKKKWLAARNRKSVK